MRHVIPCVLASLLVAQDPASRSAAQDPASRPRAEPWVVYSGHAGPAHGKRIVFVTGDEEYRSEEGMPQLARILARLGGHCTVLFTIDKKTGAIDPGVLDHIPGLEALDHADLMVLFTRFRDLPDAQMKHIADYVEAGQPIVALRTATHAFDPKTSKTYERYGWRSKTWEGGFGRQVLGETWVAHHGGHGTQSTLGVLPDTLEDRPLLRGLSGATIWDSTDVYAVRLPLPPDCATLVHGQVLAGMTPDSGPAPARKDEKSGKTVDLNLPMMPLAWTREWKAPSGKTARVFTTTLGSAQGFAQEGTRRLLVNACLWALGREESITPDLDVSLASAFDPTPFGFGKHKRGVRPAELAWQVPARQ